MNNQKNNLKNKEEIYCKRCCQSTIVSGIKFDENGVCNFCKLHDKMLKEFPSGKKGELILKKMFNKMKKAGRNKKYDCIIGLSGGRDSTYLLYKAVKEWELRPLAVHFDDHFDNPIAIENMKKACKKLNVELRTIISDWKEAKDLNLSFLKASVPELNAGTDVGIGATLYGVANKEGIKYVMIAHSFRTEGIKPLSWSFHDGVYLKNVQRQFGTVKLKKWTPNDPGFNLGIKELFYYTVIKRIKMFFPMYYVDYNREKAEKIIRKELGWVYPGAHYYDDLYHSLITYVHRVKFNISLNMNSDAGLVRTGQMSREKAIKRAESIYHIEDPKVIDLCIKKLGLKKEEFEEYMKLSPKTFRDYKTSWPYLLIAKYPIWIMSRLYLLPKITYDKYFNCGK
jgi:N-acetyl sugar amidotransferase